MKKPELLAPGGSFLSAYHAFEAGADGVYLGLKEFSARKGAQNFTLDQLRRIRQLAADRGRRIYVTVNTVIQESEMPRVQETLAWLEALSVDGVIVQDLGVYDLIARRFPRLAIHASTQMAVHNGAGLALAEELGIRRVILSRELPLEQIRLLRERHPRIELEVFIHGALCYSVSGMCLASWALTGRSGNRGDCAQICRSLFRADAGQQGCFFSCRDLFLGRDVLALAEIGIDALKIEGRMKSPEYVFNATRLYREILDHGRELPDEEYAELVRKAELGFARKGTTGWLHASSGSRLIEPGYPGHTGAFLGTVGDVQGRQISLTLSGDLALRDGLGFFLEGTSDLVAFSVGGIRKAGREARFARKGETVSVEVPPDATAAMPRAGCEIRHLSSRFLDLPQPREAGFPLYKIPVNLNVTLERDAEPPQGKGLLHMRASGFPLFSVGVTIDAAARKRPFLQILTDLFAQSGDSIFCPGLFTFANSTGLANDGIFVPPSELKKAKNELYAFLDDAFSTLAGARQEEEGARANSGRPSPLTPEELDAVSHRERLSPGRFSPIPFAAGDPSGLNPSDLALLAGFRWLPLPPVIMEEEAWIDALARLADSYGDVRFAIGLNNISHLALAAALADRPNAWFFIDFYLYAANARMISLVCQRIPRLLFAYSWIEAGEDNAALLDASAGKLPIVRISPDFRPPLFYSLGCFARHVLNNGKCFDDCPKDWSRELRQGKNRFTVVVRDCVTYLFAAPPRS
ncbi:MAG: peptidase U32 family protein [Spirochaetia bacterium]